MANKRMFDKKVVESDKFLDLPNSSKALYFMAGMEADDKGFFQPKKLQKMCGFSDDDYKILIAKSFFIPFESGVMVITDWNKNNWLDSRRITETEYVEELKMLNLINQKYELSSNCLAIAKQMLSENRIEENRIEENSIEYNIINKVDSKTTEKNNYQDEFELLWKKYPRKEGKKKSLEYYIKARKKGTTYEQVEQGIDNYNSYIKNERISEKYIKQGSTWFNQECWNDEYHYQESYLKVLEREEKENE